MEIPHHVISTESSSGEIPQRASFRSGKVSPTIHLDPKRSCLGPRWAGVPGFDPLFKRAQRWLIKGRAGQPSGSALNKASAVLNYGKSRASKRERRAEIQHDPALQNRNAPPPQSRPADQQHDADHYERDADDLSEGCFINFEVDALTEPRTEKDCRHDG